jgi:tetratricopeptide (TPR) repeat protein
LTGAAFAIHFTTMLMLVLTVAALCLAAAGIWVAVKYGSSRRQVKMVETRLDVMQRDVGKMLVYLDGLPRSTGRLRACYESGTAAMRAYKWAEAIQRFNEAMKYARGSQMVALLSLTGLCNHRVGKRAEAMQGYEQAVRLADQIGDTEGKAVALCNMGSVNQDIGELGKALRCHEEALATTRIIGDRHGEASNWGAPGLMDNRSSGCSIEPEVTFGYREEAAEDLHA